MRVLIVDDSAFYRKLLREALTSLGVEVVGIAHNGRAALEKIEELRPDLITLDLEMPELDGLGVLRELRRRESRTGVIVCSALTSEAAGPTMAALELGAFDWLPKLQQNGDAGEGMRALLQELGPKLQAFEQNRLGSAKLPPRGLETAPRSAADISDCRADVVVVGVSTGGPSALTRLIPRIPAGFPAPIVVVQHMPPHFTKSLAEDLDRISPVAVSEARHGDLLRAGAVLIAPGGRQMRIECQSGGPRIEITDDPPERHCRPSVDYLFRSAAEIYGRKTLGIILTGMGDDGTAGCRAIKRCCGRVLTQDAASCVVYGMPRSVVEAGLSDGSCSLDELAAELCRCTAKLGRAFA